MNDRAQLVPSPITPEQAGEFMRGRRTVDAFTDQPIDDNIVRQAIDAARWAPNHHLTEPWHFHLLGPQARRAVVDLNTRLLTGTRGAEVAAAKAERWLAMPGWLAVTCARDDDPVTASEDHAACACAIQNFTLYLHSAGLGSKWASGAVTRAPEFLQILDVEPTQRYCLGLLWFGHPKRRPRSQRQPLAAIISNLP